MNAGAVLVLALLAPALAFAATSLPDGEDPVDAWARYMQSGATREPAYTFPHAGCFRQAALSHGLPLTLLLAVARGESDFDAGAKSRANAHGVMQIQWPGTAQHLGIHRLSQLYEPCTNIDAGARYLAELLTRYDGDLHLALAAYNYGPGRIPPGATKIPAGALWYSGYIYRHLGFVMGEGIAAEVVATLYSEFGRSLLLSFGEPYRAEAFVAHVERRLAGMPGGGRGDAGALQIDWFRTDVGRFDVVFTYADRDAFEAGARQLRRAGFPVD